MHLDVRDLQYATFSQKLSAFDLFLMPSELKTLECDILNSDRLINLEINNKRRTSII